MVPHPTTWQNARERERQALLTTSESFARETVFLAAIAPRSLNAGSKRTSQGAAHRAVLRRAVARTAQTARGPRVRMPRGIRRGPRLLARLLTLFVT